MKVSCEVASELLRHMEWADAQVWSVVPDQAPSDARLFGCLVHVHVVQRAFLAVWRGDDVGAAVRKPEHFATLAEVRGWARTYYREAQAFIASLADAQLDQPVRMPWAGQLAERFGQPIGDTTLGETCLQVTSHSTYHRGQINARLRELGVAPPLVDYIAWLWFNRPEPRWPA